MSEIEQTERLGKIVEDLTEIGSSAARASGFLFLSGMLEVPPQELRRARRLAAARAHPDLMPEDQRAAATVVMSAINSTVDTAISEAKEPTWQA